MKHKLPLAILLVAVFSVGLLNIPKAYATGITCVQGYTGCTNTGTARGYSSSSTSFTVTMATTPTSGNVIIIVYGADATGTPTISSIVETNVNWSSGGAGLQVAQQYGTLFDVEIWLGYVGTAASGTITINTNGGVFTPGLRIADAAEYNGISSVNPLDKSASQSLEVGGNAATLNVPTGTTATTTRATELWIGAIACTANQNDNACNQSSPVNSFTLVDGVSVNYGTNVYQNSVGYLAKIVSSTGTANSGTTVGQNGIGGTADGLGAIATFGSPTFSVSNSGDISAAPTGSGSNTITATALVGTPNVTLTISGLPSGATSGFSKYKGATTYTSTLTITTSAVLVGTYSIIVTGTNASEVHTTVFSLIVTSNSVSNSGSINVIAGYSGTTSLSVKAATAVTVTLSCLSGLPAGATCSFGPISGTANYTSVLTISTNPANLGGTYSIVVQANSTYGAAVNAVTLKILGFSLSSVNNLAANQGDVSDQFLNWLTVTSANIGSPSSTVTGTFVGTPAGVTFSAIGPSTIPGTLVYALYMNVSAFTIAGTYPITLVMTGANQTHSVSFALVISIPTITTTTIVTQILTNNVGVTSTIATTGTVFTTFTQPFATATQTLTKYSGYSDIPLVTYGLAILLVLTPTMIVLVVNKTVAGMVIAMSTGIVWAVASNVLNIDALLLLVGVAAIALLFRVRGAQ